MQTKRSNAGALIGGAVLVAFGLLTLVGQVFRGLNWGFLWPIMIIGIGVLFFVAMFAGGKQAAALAIPGSIVSGVGLVFLFQNIAHHWESMFYFWTLIILFVGTGIYIMGRHSGDIDQKQSGACVMKVGLILFIIFGALFETLLWSSDNFIFPILLILLGVFSLLSRSGLLSGKKYDSSAGSIRPMS